MGGSSLTTCYVDLDGTLLDVAARHFGAYCQVVLEAGGEPLTLRAYWLAKRQGCSFNAFLVRSGLGGEADAYRRRFLRLIEHPSLLESDTVKPGTLLALGRLKQLGYQLVLVTLRRRTILLDRQLRRLALRAHFGRVLCSRWRGNNLVAKRRLIQADVTARDSAGWLIGDTSLDVLVAHQLGMKAAVVSDGLEAARSLANAGPELLADSLMGVARRLSPAARGKPNALAAPPTDPEPLIR